MAAAHHLCTPANHWYMIRLQTAETTHFLLNSSHALPASGSPSQLEQVQRAWFETSQSYAHIWTQCLKRQLQASSHASVPCNLITTRYWLTAVDASDITPQIGLLFPAMSRLAKIYWLINGICHILLHAHCMTNTHIWPRNTMEGGDSPHQGRGAEWKCKNRVGTKTSPWRM